MQVSITLKSSQFRQSHIATDPGLLAWLPSWYIQSATKHHNHHGQPNSCPHEDFCMHCIHHHPLTVHLNKKVVMVK